MKERSKSAEHLFLNKISLQFKCAFCQKLKQQKTMSFSFLLMKALYSKYSSSQNYYYSKLINDILENESTELVVKYRDLQTNIEEEEYFKRFYYRKEIRIKQVGLLEYYKYHKDIPRLFMSPIYHTIYKFHEKKRRIEYGKIKHQLGIQDEPKEESEALQNENKKKQKTSQDCSVRQLKNMLQGVNLEESSYLQIRLISQQQHSQSISQLKDIIALLDKEQQQQELQSYPKQSVPITQLSLQQGQKQEKPQIQQFGSNQKNFKQQIQTSEQIQKLLIQQKKDIRQQYSNDIFKKIDLPIKIAENLRRSKQMTAPKLRTHLPIQQNQAISQSIGQLLTQRQKQELKGRQASNSNFNLKEIERKQSKEISLRSGQMKSLHNSNSINNNQLQKPKAHLKQMSLGQNIFQQQIQTLKSLYSQQVKEVRTKSSDQIVSPTRPKSASSQQKWNQQIKFLNNVYVQGQKKQPQIYTINQNNIVNIYLDDIKKSFKSVSLTTRGQSPQKFAARKVFICDQQVIGGQKNISPIASLKKKKY